MASWLFLAVSLVGAALVWNVYRPVHASPRLAGLSFFAGWLTSELAVHHVLWQGVATAIFVAAGALERPAGWAGLAVTGVSWAALGAHYLRGWRAKDTVEAALREGLGPGYRDRVAPAHRGALEERIDWGAIAAPFPIRHPEVERIADVRYGRASAIDLKLDLYVRRDRPAGCPVLFYVHGGAWVIGTKNTQGLPLCYHLAARGWLCVNVNYRLSPHATFPDHLVDLKRALAWVREHAAEYGGDPSLVVTTGGSAGGHLAALLALTPNDPEYQPGFEDADTSVQGCIPIYGVYDFTNEDSAWHRRSLLPFLERHVLKTTLEEDPKAFEKASPVHRIGPDAPPFLIVHGAADTLVPVAEAKAFADRLREVSRSPVCLDVVPGAQHAFELFPSLRSDLTRQGIDRFLAWLRSTHPSTGSRAA